MQLCIQNDSKWKDIDFVAFVIKLPEPYVWSTFSKNGSMNLSSLFLEKIFPPPAQHRKKKYFSYQIPKRKKVQV